jgi:30S ribosomal protein S31
MGKGDRKSKKGKIFMGSYGKSRPRKRKKTVQAAIASPASAEPKAEKKKTAAKKKKTEE